MKCASAALVALAVAGGACSKQHPAAGRQGPAILALVPADTPYVLATLTPWPRAYYDHFIKTQAAVWRQAIAEVRKQAGAAPTPGARLLLALFDEIEPHLSFDGMVEIGLQPGAPSVLYGIGLLPALRVELRDEAALTRFFDRVVKRSGVAVSRDAAPGRRTWSWPLSTTQAGWTAVLAIDRGQLLGTVAPRALLRRTLARLLGDERPGRSLRDSGALDRIAGEYHFRPFMVGYLDFQRLAAVFTDERHPDRDVFRAGGVPLPAVPPACRDEIPGLIALAPRWVLGADDVSATHMDFWLTIELRADVAAALRAVRAPMPGVAAPLGDALFSMGAALDVARGAALVRTAAQHVTQAPYRCPGLASANRAAADLARRLGKPLGVVGELRGFFATVHSVEIGLGMPSVKAYGVLAASDEVHVVDLLRALKPFGVPDLPPDGTPVPLPVPQLAPLHASVAMKGAFLGASLGEGTQPALARLMAAPPHPDLPLASLAFHGGKLRRLLTRVIPTAGHTLGIENGVYAFTLAATPHGLRLQFDYRE